MLLGLIALIAGAIAAGGSFKDDFTVPGIESQKAQDLLEQRFPAQSGTQATVVFSAPHGGTGRDGQAQRFPARALGHQAAGARVGGRHRRHRRARHSRGRPRARPARRPQPDSDSTQRQAYDRVARGFGPGVNGPLVVVASLPKGATDKSLDRVTTRLAGDPEVADVAAPTLNAARPGQERRIPSRVVSRFDLLIM